MKANSFLVFKYIFPKTKFNLVSIISAFSLFVLTISFFSFFTILSVFSGLENYSLNFTKYFDPDIKILPSQEKYILYNDIINNALKNTDGIVNSSRVLRGKAIINHNEKTNYTEIIGVDSEFEKVILIDSIISVGRNFIRSENEAVTSYEISNNLNLTLFNPEGIFKLSVVDKAFPENTFSPIKKSIFLSSSGVFKTKEGNNEKLVITGLKKVQDLFSLNKNNTSEILIKTQGNATLIAEKLRTKLPNYVIKTRMEINELVFKIMNSEKLFVSLIMILIIIVSSFNVIASTLMLIVEKENDIKTLKAIGMNNFMINKIFITHSSLITLIGGSAGLVLSFFLIIIQQYSGLFTIAGTMIPYPVSITVYNTLIVFGSLFLSAIMSSLASKYISSFFLKKKLN